MFKVKKLVLLGFVVTSMLAFVACGDDSSRDSSNEGDSLIGDSSGGILTVESLLESPSSFSGEVSVVGTTRSDGSFSFALTQEGISTPLPIDYRGGQALPAYGIEVIVTGHVVIDCCANASLTAVSYQVVE